MAPTPMTNRVLDRVGPDAILPPGITQREVYQLSSGGTLLFASPPAKIGKHEWCFTVYERTGNQARVSSMFWRRVPEPPWEPEAWRDYHEWPSYDFNDGSYAGCPRSLAKLHRDHAETINRLICRETATA